LGGERDEQSRAEVCVLRTDGFTGNERVCGNAIEFSSPTTQQNLFYWKTRPCSVLILKKLGPELLSRLYELALWLHSEHGMRVIVEWADFKALHGSLPFLETFAPQVEAASLHRRVDFVLCLGGDGVILHSSQLFAGAAPPVVAFSLGSLGFLANHDFADYARDLTRLIRAAQDGEGVFITLRMRLHCEILRKGKRLPGKVYSVLNEVVVDRGSNPYLSKIECYERGRLITKVQADGVLISTPTGSTAYSVSAGGSMVHPSVPAILFTPICPHSLSFRPILLPDSAELELRVPDDARDTAWVCFDGKKRQQLQRGDSVTIRMSAHPLPTINKRDQTDDWVASLTECLNWNDRIDQLGVAPPSAQVTANSSSSIRTESWHRQIPLVDK
jgi:NAD+ kinase